MYEDIMEIVLSMVSIGWLIGATVSHFKGNDSVEKKCLLWAILTAVLASS